MSISFEINEFFKWIVDIFPKNPHKKLKNGDIVVMVDNRIIEFKHYEDRWGNYFVGELIGNNTDSMVHQTIYVEIGQPDFIYVYETKRIKMIKSREGIL